MTTWHFNFYLCGKSIFNIFVLFWLETFQTTVQKSHWQMKLWMLSLSA